MCPVGMPHGTDFCEIVVKKQIDNEQSLRQKVDLVLPHPSCNVWGADWSEQAVHDKLGVVGMNNRVLLCRNMFKDGVSESLLIWRAILRHSW